MNQHSQPAVAVALICAAVICVACHESKHADSLNEHMSDHFTQADEVRRAVIDGDVDGARSAARWLADHGHHRGLPKEWAAHLTTMQEAARDVAQATDVSEAALGVGRMGQSCGWCHETLGVYMAPEAGPAEPAGDRHETAAHMRRHEWAADRMWEGLIGPSRDVWQQGAGMLLEPALFDGEWAAEELKSLAETVQTLGEKGKDARGPEARAIIYGELLATCAECHRTVGMTEPKP